MELSLDVLAILFAVAALAGFIDAIAGGGGLLTVPALLMVGMSPAMALGTNKLQGCGGSFAASLYFWRKGAVNLRQIWQILALTFIGAVAGTLFVQSIDASVVKKFIPALILAIGLYFLFSPKLGESDRQQRLSYLAFGLTAGLSLGFYDGFFGPGVGSLMALAFVSLLGFNLTKATAHAKTMNFTSNFASLIFFILGGQVVWLAGLVMMVGQFIGANLGAKMVLTKGKAIIRPLVVVMSLLMTVKMAFEQGWFS